MAEPKEPKRPGPPGIPLDDPEDLDGDDAGIPLADEPVLPKRPADDATTPAPKAPKRPPIGTPGAPLPRLWKAQPDEQPADEDEPSDSKSKKKKTRAEKSSAKAEKSSAKAEKSGARAEKSVDLVKSSSAPPAGKVRDKKSRESKPDKVARPPKAPSEDGKKPALIEETPFWETQEARERVRLVVGGGLALVGLIAFFVVAVRFLSNKPEPADEPIPEAMSIAVSTAPTLHERDEEEARILFDRAREVARNRNVNLSVSLLRSVTTKYPATTAAGDARQALERPSQNLPLFLDSPAVVASAVEATRRKKAEGPKPSPKTIAATTTNVSTTNSAPANLVLPANPAEATRVPAPSAATAPAPGPSAATPTPSKRLPKGFRPREGAAVHESGWPTEIVGDRDGAPMALVPGGTFIQGRDDADSNEAPAHDVRLGTFYIDRHEVTVRQFNLYQKEKGPRSDRARALAKDPALARIDAEDDRPVVMVSARDAKDFADWAGKYLPTEAQWEAAARTPDGRVYPWGPTPPAWSKPRAHRQIDPVMSFPMDVSPYGVFDLSGNAWEWTKDWYDSKYYVTMRNATADNPVGPAKPRSLQLVVKGSGRDWTASKREGLKYDVRLPYVGFRCALQVEGPGNAFEPPPSARAPQGQPAPAAAAGDAGIPPF